MENYEQKYKEALGRAKDCCVNKKISELEDTAQQLCEYIFPELHESEDERIRKGLIKGLTAMRDIHKHQIFSDDAINIDDAIAWLEKQGEKEKNHSIEPKFKVGDWITNGEYTWKVIDIKPLDYILQSQNGDIVDDNISYVDENFRLWTIQDARDGNVFAIGNEYFLFKNKKDNTLPVVCISHCFCDSAGAFRVTNGRDCGEFLSIENGIKVCPATKEQRDLLFQKMEEAGYEWDAEKKDLKKIEQNCYHNDGLYYAIDILEKTLGKVEGYQSDDGKMEHQAAIEIVKALFHKKPTEWSEEYDKNLQKIIEIIIQSPLISNYKEMYISWLRTLKPQPKQEWSEEDENIRKQLIKHCSGPHELYDERNWDKWLNWLKSLKPHWKPSEEQILSLQEAISIVGENSISGRNLIEILEQFENL